VQPGDKCSDLLAMGNKALADIVIIGASPSEGKTIEKFTEGADPHCKKPPPTTTTTSTKHGCQDQNPLPKECRYDLAISVDAPDFFNGRVAPQTITMTMTVENVGPVASPPIELGRYGPYFGPAYLTSPHGKSALDIIKGPATCRFSHYAQCRLKPLAPKESESFTFVFRWLRSWRDGFVAARKRGIIESIVTGATVNSPQDRGSPCETEEVTCTNNTTEAETALH
jgi:hypothetical protein